MKAIPRVDFLARPQRPWGGVALCGLTLLVLGAVALGCWRLDEANRYEAALLGQRVARLAPPPPRKLTEAERVRLAQAASLAGQLRAPWADLLAAFEEHGSGEIGLLKLEPDARAGVVRVTGQARDPKALFTYLKELEGDARLLQVALTTHQKEREIPGQPLRFTIQARWRALPASGKALS